MLSRVLVAVLIVPSLAFPLTCHSLSQPNPIAHDYPADATGNINGTTAIIPISYDVARSIIPAKYSILTSAYQAVFPTLEEGTYPAVLESIQDHDVKQFFIPIPDFSRFALKFPFVDRLGDGYSSFKYISPQMISAENLIAIIGSSLYSTTISGTFDPPCEAYGSDNQGTTYINAYAVPHSPSSSRPDISSNFRVAQSIPYSLKAFVNVTNQPMFGDGLPVCDNYITLFNTTLTEGQYAPVPVGGTVSVRPPFYPVESTFTDVYGYTMANAFIERNDVPCEKLKGYSGTGSGDSG